MTSSARPAFSPKNSRVPSVNTALGARASTRIPSRPSSRASPVSGRSPERPSGGAYHVRSGAGASDVERDADRLPALGLHEIQRRRAIVHVRGNDKRSRRRQASCEFLPDPAGRPGDDDFVTNRQLCRAVAPHPKTATERPRTALSGLAAFAVFAANYQPGRPGNGILVPLSRLLLITQSCGFVKRRLNPPMLQITNSVRGSIRCI
jgi:hypothetical protein